MDVSDIMTTDPVTLARDADLAKAMSLMDEYDIRHLPIVEKGGRLVGLVSDRELLEATGWLAGMARRFDVETVEDIMHTGLETIDAADTVVMASVQMATTRVGCLPVVGDGDVLAGIVTETDLLEAWCRSKPAAAETATVAQHMSKPVHSVPSATTLAAARQLCASKRIRHLPVVDDGALVGIVSDRDLRRARGAGESDELPVGKVMTRSVVTVEPSLDLVAAGALMADEAVSALPVVDDGRLVGIVTLRDIVDHAIDALREI